MYMVLVEIVLIGWVLAAVLAAGSWWARHPRTRKPSRTTLAVEIATASDGPPPESRIPVSVTGRRLVYPANMSRTRGMTRVP